MFRVLIADDENSVIQSLVGVVPWVELGLVVAATASDGREALRLAETENVDVAIIDIRMPGLNGLELCEQLRRRNEKMQLIIASGYAEFAYAEKAIQYGVIGYCLKPLDYTQMTRFLRKAVQNLNRDRHIGDWEDLVDMLERRNSVEIWECFSKFGFTQERYFLAASVGERKLEALEQAGVSLRLGWRQWGYIMKIDRVSELAEVLEELTGWSGIGYLEQAVPGSELYDGLEECNRRAFQYFVDKKERICASPDEGRANRWLDSVQAKLQSGQWSDLKALLDEIGDKGRGDFTVYSALRLCNMISTHSQPRDEENDSYVYSIEQLVESYGDFAGMIGRLEQLLEERSLEAENQPKFSNAAFMKLMQYINENYKGEISLSGAAQVLHMNSNYVSQLFKKESGITFVHYVTQKRLEDAKELLTNTKKPLTDIALEVGFNDTFHFIKTFKKVTGMTPGQYRTGS